MEGYTRAYYWVETLELPVLVWAMIGADVTFVLAAVELMRFCLGCSFGFWSTLAVVFGAGSLILLVSFDCEVWLTFLAAKVTFAKFTSYSTYIF